VNSPTGTSYEEHREKDRLETSKTRAPAVMRKRAGGGTRTWLKRNKNKKKRPMVRAQKSGIHGQKDEKNDSAKGGFGGVQGATDTRPSQGGNTERRRLKSLDNRKQIEE